MRSFLNASAERGRREEKSPENNLALILPLFIRVQYYIRSYFSHRRLVLPPLHYAGSFPSLSLSLFSHRASECVGKSSTSFFFLSFFLSSFFGLDPSNTTLPFLSPARLFSFSFTPLQVAAAFLTSHSCCWRRCRRYRGHRCCCCCCCCCRPSHPKT